jgi:hypothetical protein
MRANLANYSLIVCLPFLLLAQPSPAAGGNATLAKDDYAIYAAALESLYSKEKIDRIVLIDQTGAGVPPGMAAMTRLGDAVREFYKDLPEGLRDELNSRNKASADVDRDKIGIKAEIVMLAYEDAKKIVSGGWEDFGKRYSRCPGITLLSLPALNAEKDQALLYVGMSCGIVCGDGELLLLMKKDGHWFVKKKAIVWVS